MGKTFEFDSELEAINKIKYERIDSDYLCELADCYNIMQYTKDIEIGTTYYNIIKLCGRYFLIKLIKDENGKIISSYLPHEVEITYVKDICDYEFKLKDRRI